MGGCLQYNKNNSPIKLRGAGGPSTAERITNAKTGEGHILSCLRNRDQVGPCHWKEKRKAETARDGLREGARLAYGKPRAMARSWILN